MLVSSNHCISFVPGDGKRPDLFLDGTAILHPVGTVPEMDQGAEVIVVRGETPEKRTVPVITAEQNERDLAAEIEIARDGSATIRMTWKATGNQGVALRTAFRGEDGLRRQRLTDFLTAIFGELEITKVETTDLEDLTREPIVQFEAVVPRLLDFQGDAEGLVPTTLQESALPAITRNPVRERALLLPPPETRRTTLEIVLADGLQFAEVPGALAEEVASCSYRCEVERLADNRLRIVRTLVGRKRRVEAEDYKALRELARQIESNEQERLTIERLR